MKKIISIILITIVALSFCSFGGSQTALAAAPIVVDFDYTYVLDDLVSSTVLGEEFNVTDFPFDAEGSLQLMSIVEYAYASEPARRGHFGLYIYLYNPAGIDYSPSAPGNKIQIATKYNDNGSAIDYEKFDLKILSKSNAPYKNRFIKLKVVDHKTDGRYISDRVNAEARRYDISGMELIADGASNAVEYSIARTYTFTGFAAGYGNSALEASTLGCSIKEIETIELQVNHTYYRTGLSSLGVDHENQLDSVYFGVDAAVLEEYGRLQRIKAEWYEYRTKPILVTSNENVYNGIEVGSGSTDFGIGLYYNFKRIAESPIYFNYWDWGYNTQGKDFRNTTDDIIYYMFYVDDIASFDPRGEEIVVGGVKSSLLYQHILQYDKTFVNGVLAIKNGTISADLFEDSVDVARVPLFNNLETEQKNGYYVHDFDVDVDLHQMPSYNTTNPGFIQKVQDFGFWNTVFGMLPELDDHYSDVSPIYQVSSGDLQGSNAEIATRLLINENDVGKFKTYFADEKQSGREVILFRFATTDYFSAPLTITGSPGVWQNEAYMAQQTVFLDFDIIQLTFNKNGLYRVIPVVHNPIDTVADLTPPAFIPSPPLQQFFDGLANIFDFNFFDLPEWARTAIMVVIGSILLILLVFLWPLFRVLFKSVWFVITLPYRAIKMLVIRVQERKKLNREVSKPAKPEKPKKTPKLKKQKAVKIMKTKTKGPRVYRPKKPRANKILTQKKYRGIK